NVYPGIDLTYYGNHRQLEYDFTVAPGVDPGAIRLAFAGADRIRVDASGDLVLHTAAGDVRQHRPHVYQEINGARRPVPGGYVFRNASSVMRHPTGGRRRRLQIAHYASRNAPPVTP